MLLSPSKGAVFALTSNAALLLGQRKEEIQSSLYQDTIPDPSAEDKDVLVGPPQIVRIFLSKLEQ